MNPQSTHLLRYFLGERRPAAASSSRRPRRTDARGEAGIRGTPRQGRGSEAVRRGGGTLGVHARSTASFAISPSQSPPAPSLLSPYMTPAACASKRKKQRDTNIHTEGLHTSRNSIRIGVNNIQVATCYRSFSWTVASIM